MEGLPDAPAATGGEGTADRRAGRDEWIGGRKLSGRRIILWRHGRTAWNAAGRFQGQLDPPLDDLGCEQALAAAQVLLGYGPQLILSSDSVRAATTAATLSVAVQPDPRLREIHLGAWQGLTGAEAKAAFPAEFDAWLAGVDVRRGNGETYAEVGVRAQAAIEDELPALPAGGVLVAVTHGGTSRALTGSYLGLPPEHWWRLGPLGNCRWSVLVEADRGWRLGEHNVGAPTSA